MTQERNFKVNSQLLPAGFPREFDAHIYFDEGSRSFAEAFRAKAISVFEGQRVFTGEMIPVGIGPHPIPMFEINFPKEMFTEVVLWLMKERGDLSVLVYDPNCPDVDEVTLSLNLGDPLQPSPISYSADSAGRGFFRTIYTVADPSEALAMP